MFNQNTSGYSLADIASALGGKGGLFGDGNGAATLLIIIFLFCFMGGFGGIGGNSAIDTAALLSMNNSANRAVTTDDLQNQFNFAALERENGEIIASVGQSKYDNINVMKDIQSQLQMQLSGLSTMEQAIGDKLGECCCAINRNIDSVNYNAALNTASINANTTAQTQKILDAIAGNRMAEMQNEINSLQLQQALCGVVRYPLATTYTAGFSPIYPNPGFVG